MTILFSFIKIVTLSFLVLSKLNIIYLLFPSLFIQYEKNFLLPFYVTFFEKENS